MVYGRNQAASSSKGRQLRRLSAMVVVMGSLVTEVTASPQAQMKMEKNAIFQMVPVSGVQFTQDLLGEKPTRSEVDCGGVCVGEAGCSMFTFTPGRDGPGGSCRLHRKKQTPQGGQQPAPGARSFNIAITDFWIQTACIASSDCKEPMAACYSGQCLCDGGFFFDYFQNACESRCTRSLGDTYVQYRDMDLWGHDLGNSPAYGDKTNCLPRCTADPDCTGFVHATDYDQDRCYYKTSTAQDYPEDWISYPLRHYNQITCH